MHKPSWIPRVGGAEQDSRSVLKQLTRPKENIEQAPTQGICDEASQDKELSFNSLMFLHWRSLPLAITRS